MTAIMEIQWRRSFASPLCFHAGQLHPHSSQTYPVSPKILNLCMDVCQNAIDLLNRDREPNRPPVKCLLDFLTVHQAHRCLGYTEHIVFFGSIIDSSSTPDLFSFHGRFAKKMFIGPSRVALTSISFRVA